jgi:dnd system-associated protein 4
MERRIRVPKDKGETIDKLTKSDEYPNGPFRLRADVITFAAAVGFRRERHVEFTETLEPIRLEVFERKGYDSVIYWIALASTKDPAVLGQTDEALDKRVTIFEEYANGGLEFLRQEIVGLDDPLPRILLLIGNERASCQNSQEDFNLEKFLA